MLLDSGADISLLPRQAIENLVTNIEQLPKYELEAFDGVKSSAPVVTFELQFLGKSFRGQFPVVAGAYGILGRNVMNAVVLLLDGPSLNWEEDR